MRRRLTGFAILAALVVAGGVTAADGMRAANPARLQPFHSCSELVDYAKRNAAKVVGSGGIVRPPGVTTPAARGAERGDGADSSATNVQEAGVDEPDIVKTDGSAIFAVAADKLFAVEARGPRLLDSLRLDGWGHELLLHDGRMLVFSRARAVEPDERPGGAPFIPTKTIVSEVDVRNPSSLRVVRTLTVDGSVLAARLVGPTARLVIASAPRFPPPEGATPKAGQEPSKDTIASSSLRNWLPYWVLVDRRTNRKTTHALVQCRAVHYPPLFSGLGLVTVLTIDLEQGLPPVDSDALMMGAGTVYSSRASLYVASQRWFVPPAERAASPPEMTTEVHRFDTSRTGRTEYRSSGSVRGFLLNQWSLSEDRGYLRVATTEVPAWLDSSPRQESESGVSVLAERAGRLVEVGRVGELGRGERVYAVRFVGDVGFVVTFRQIDPLYTIDLADPARPRVLGALKIRGYSSYLHPVANDLLLGVGQDATDEGRVLGTQLSLFDVSDLRRPARLDAVPLGPGSSEVEYDHHAFLYWPAKTLAVLPVQISSPDAKGGPFVGAIAFRVGRKDIAQLGRVTHPSPDGQVGGVPVRRSVVLGDRLFTISERGVKASSLATLADVAWVPFG